MTLSIRKLKSDDAAMVRWLLVRLFEGLSNRTYPAEFIDAQRALYTEAVIRRKLGRPDSVSYGAFAVRTFAGFIIAFEMAPGLFYAEWGGVTPSLRRTGVMRALMRRMEAAVRAVRGRKVYLYTSLKNIPAAQTYLDCGYVVEGVLRNHFFGADFLLFGKSLRRVRFSAAYSRRPDFRP